MFHRLAQENHSTLHPQYDDNVIFMTIVPLISSIFAASCSAMMTDASERRIDYWAFLSESAAGFVVLRPRNRTIIADGNATVISVALMKWDTRWIETEANSTSSTQHKYATAPIMLVNSLHKHTHTHGTSTPRRPLCSSTHYKHIHLLNSWKNLTSFRCQYFAHVHRNSIFKSVPENSSFIVFKSLHRNFSAWSVKLFPLTRLSLLKLTPYSTAEILLVMSS